MIEFPLFIASILVGVIGLPHGALDPVIAWRAGLLRSPLTISLFLLGYLSLATIVIGLWLVMPVASLCGFLCISALHFGRDWRDQTSLGGLGYGLFVLGLPGLINPIEVKSIFSSLLFGHSPYAALQILQVFGVVGIILILTEFRRLSVVSKVELFALSSGAFLLSPLWFFVFYFCGLHSFRHYAKHIFGYRKIVSFPIIGTVMVATLATLFLAAMVWKEVHIFYESTHDLQLQLIFIGLAALTVPHMFLLEWVSKIESR